MKAVRVRLVAFTLAVLAIQVGLIATAPAALCRIASAPVDEASTCTCVHADGVECPMHRGAKPSGQKSGLQICTGCGDQAAAIVTALTASVAIVQPSSRLVPPAATTIALAARATPTLDVDRRPTSPPPRS